MKKIMIMLVMICILGVLSACGNNKQDNNESSVSSTVDDTSSDISSDVVSSLSPIEDVSVYQSYTVSDDGVIIDTKTGIEIQDDDLLVDEIGNIISKSHGQILVTSEIVQSNKALLTVPQDNQPTVQKYEETSHSTSSSEGKHITSENPIPQNNNTSLQEQDRYSSESELNVKYPVMGERVWSFYSTDPANCSTEWNIPKDSALTVHTIKMEQNLSMEISCHYFARVDGSSEEIFNTDRIITVDGVEYIWTMSSHYIGGCAPQYNGDVSVALRCYDQSGRFLYDELIFTRVGPDTMVLKSNDGNTLWLHPGDTFTR